MPDHETKFRVSSALKTIIGKELITDDFIAVFELVKNSFDAHAKRVDIIFENLNSENPRLIIKDDGKGMDKKDIDEKWLFVAYSAKKEGTEDYRDKIQSRRIHTGTKGIGRFSCDKLGSKLVIFTKKRGDDFRINKLMIDWTTFEKNAQDEFVEIPIEQSIVRDIPYKNFKHGTILEITCLREEWDRSKLLKLRHYLEKLINPNQENDPNGFSIFLDVEEERDKDIESKSGKDLRKVINGQIENTIFENLRIKTTKIHTAISADGKEIITTLNDRGTSIYTIKEENPYKNLQDIEITLYYLNKSAKLTFSKKMGVPPVEYGSVFLYKNGFRIYPFGEEGEDLLKMDRRKQQGHKRYLGTREVIGRIEINGPNDNFKETSSRDGGLIKNNSYKDLEEFFYEFALKRLERFVVGVIKWGDTDNLLKHETLSPQEIKNNIFDVIKSLTKSKNVLDFNYDPKLLNILQNRSEESVSTLLRNFQVIAEKSNNPLLVKEVVKAQKQLDVLKKAKEEAEEEAEKARNEAKKAAEEAEKAEEKAQKAEEKAKEAQETVRQKTSQNLFLQSILSEDLKHVVSLHHHIGISAGTIEQYVKNLSRKISKGEPLTPEIVQIALERISYQAKMISSTVKFATKANFNLESAEINNTDIISFIKEYAINVCAGIIKATDDIDIEFKQQKPGDFILTFKPIDVSIIIDNMLSNSRKADANKFSIVVTDLRKDSVEFAFRDNGKGIPRKNVNKIFDIGFTTTDGSGLGLYHVYKTVKEMGGEIKLNVYYDKGTEFLVRFKK